MEFATRDLFNSLSVEIVPINLNSALILIKDFLVLLVLVFHLTQLKAIVLAYTKYITFVIQVHAMLKPCRYVNYSLIG